MSRLKQAYGNLKPVQRIRLSSGPVVYRVVGSGPPLLLVHGWGGSSRHWLTTLEHFAELRTVYALDLPGHGESPPLAEMTSAERVARLVLEFANEIGLERFDVNGHSFGAAVAAYMATQAPERVQRLIISSFGIPATAMERAVMDLTYLQMNTALRLGHFWLGFWQPWQTAWQLWMVGASHMPLIPWVATRPFFYHLPDDFWMVHEGLVEFLLMDQRTSLENTISLGNPALRAALGSITAPTLLVAGRQDMILPPFAVESAASLIPHARLAWVDECGHLPMIEQPDTYHQIVDSFLNEPLPNLEQRPAA